MDAARYRSRLSRSTAILIASNAGGAGLSFLLSALIGRALGEDGLGVYAVATAWSFSVSLLVEFGLGTLMTREITRDLVQIDTAASRYLNAVALARILIGGAWMLLLVAAAPLLSDDPRVVTGIQVSAPLVIIFPYFTSFTAVLRAQNRMTPILWLNIGMLTAQVLLTALVFAAGGGVILALIVNVVTSAGQLIAAWSIYRWGNHYAGRDREALRPLMRRALPFALAALFALLQLRVSALLLERLVGASEVGYFTAANRFLDAVRLIPNAFYGAFFPTLTALAADRPLLQRTFNQAMLALGGFGLVSSVGLILFASWLIPFAFGAGFDPAVGVLQVLAASLVFALLRGGRTLYWYALGREGYVNLINGLVIGIQIALSLWLIPERGALGAALVHVAVEVLALALLWKPLIGRRA